MREHPYVVMLLLSLVVGSCSDSGPQDDRDDGDILMDVSGIYNFETSGIEESCGFGLDTVLHGGPSDQLVVTQSGEQLDLRQLSPSVSSSQSEPKTIEATSWHGVLQSDGSFTADLVRLYENSVSGLYLEGQFSDDAWSAELSGELTIGAGEKAYAFNPCIYSGMHSGSKIEE